MPEWSEVIKIDRSSRIPLYFQFQQGLEHCLIEGVFKVGDRLPSEREFSEKLNINRFVVRQALEELIKEGVLEKRHGAGTFVKDATPVFKRYASMSTGVVGIIIPFFDYYHISFVNVIVETLHNAGFRAIVGKSQYDPSLEEGEIRAMLKMKVDGLILFPYFDKLGDEYVKKIYNFQIPCVFSHCSVNLQVDYVNVDNLEGGRRAVRKLLELGYRRIAYLTTSWQKNFEYSQLRAQGYREAMQEAGLAKFVRFFYADSEDYKKIIESAPDVEAFFCVNDACASRLRRAAEGMGLKIPDDVAIMGFNGIPLLETITHPVSTMRVKFDYIGKRLSQILLKKIEGDKEPLHRELVPPEYIDVGTV